MASRCLSLNSPAIASTCCNVSIASCDFLCWRCCLAWSMSFSNFSGCGFWLCPQLGCTISGTVRRVKHTPKAKTLITIRFITLPTSLNQINQFSNCHTRNFDKITSIASHQKSFALNCSIGNLEAISVGKRHCRLLFRMKYRTRHFESISIGKRQCRLLFRMKYRTRHFESISIGKRQCRLLFRMKYRTRYLEAISVGKRHCRLLFRMKYRTRQCRVPTRYLAEINTELL